MNRDYSRHFVEDFFAKSGATRPINKALWSTTGSSVSTT